MSNLTKGMNEEGKKEGEAEHKRLLTIEKTLRVDLGEVVEGWAERVMGCVEYWMIYTGNESLNSTPETNIALYIN